MRSTTYCQLIQLNTHTQKVNTAKHCSGYNYTIFAVFLYILTFHDKNGERSYVVKEEFYSGFSAIL